MANRNEIYHNPENGFSVFTAADAAAYLGYPVGYFGTGFMVGGWNGVSTSKGTFATLEEAKAQEL